MSIEPIDIAGLARLSGATSEDGSRAERVFCFTEPELTGFVQRLTQELCRVVKAEAIEASPRFMGEDPPASVLTQAMRKVVGLS